MSDPWAASATLAAAPSLHAVATVTARASAHLAAAPAISANAHGTQAGTAHLAASPLLSAAAIRALAGAAHLQAPGVITAAAAVTPGARMSAQAHLSASAVLARQARASLSAAPSLHATAHGTARPAAALSASPVLTAVPLAVIASRAALSAAALLSSAADVRFGPPLPRRPLPPQPAWQRDVQAFAVSQERQRHAEALWQYGELVMFCLLWRPQDVALSLARRCTRCFTPSAVIPVTPADPAATASAESRIAAAYGQGNQNRCSLCYGTQLIAAAPATVPGVRALLVRPAILTDTDQGTQRTAKGVVSPGTVSVQATPDFRANALDYMFRSDGRRYQLSVPGRTTLRTGFASPWQQSAGIGYNLLNARLEDPAASAAYDIPPPQARLAQALGTYTRIPVSYAWIEQVNGPLIPGEAPPPAASGRYQPPVTFPLP